ncbi:MAG: acyl carrier protein [Myxococcales bacterium]|nr:acyl carrier protein [Myxococcales bacterium]
MRAVEAVIRSFLAAQYLEERDGKPRLSASTNVWRDVGSLTLLQLVAFVEKKFAFKVRPIDFAPQNFATISAIAHLVVTRRPGAADR